MAIMTVLEQLMFSTFRIVTDRGHGTGFVYSHGINAHYRRDFLVTNRHVVEATHEGELTFTGTKHSAGAEFPEIGQGAMVPVQDEAWHWSYHPSAEIDIAAMRLGPISTHVSGAGHRPYYAGLTHRWLAGHEELQQLDVLEDVIFVGYPEDAYDQKNNLPVVRKGTTASLPWVDYEGRPEFLIDASVFPGSSGSPVFIYNRPPWQTKYGQLVKEERLLFLGVLKAAQYRNSTGVIVPDADEEPQRRIVAEEMIDLGVVLKARSVAETVEHILRG